MVHDRTVVLVGRTGNGKSATGNSIIGEKVFESKRITATSQLEITTTTCAIKTRTDPKNGRILNVIDTPGLADFIGNPEFIEKEILGLAKDGLHAVLVVLSMSKGFSQEEKDAVKLLMKFFGDKISDYMIMVITGGDELEEDDETIENFIKGDGPEQLQLKEIMALCHNRYVVFDNRTKDERQKANQRDQLISLVDKVPGTPITNDVFRQMKKDTTEISPVVSGSSSEEQHMTSSNDMITRNLILVGRTGNGKSATGNSILGQKKKFKSKISAVGVTTSCAKERTEKDGKIINVIDTPGLFDFSGDADFIQKEIINCMGLEKDDGIHAVLLVLSLRNRFSKEEQKAVSYLKTCFSEKICDYMIVVITGGDELEDKGELEDLLGQDCPEPLKDILKICENRCVVMDNRTEDDAQKEKQLQELYCLVEKVLEKNDGKPYIEDIIQENQEELNQLRNNMEKRVHEERRARSNAEEMSQRELTKLKNEVQNIKDRKTREAEDPSAGTAEKSCGWNIFN